MDSLAGDMLTAQQNLFNDPVSVVAGPAYGIFVFTHLNDRAKT